MTDPNPHASYRAPRPAETEPAEGVTEPTFVRRVTLALSIASLFVIALLLLLYAPEVLILFFAAVWFGAVIHFAAKAVARWTGLSHGWAMGVVVTVLIAFFAGFFFLLGMQLAQQVNDFVGNIDEALSSIREKAIQQFPQAKRFLGQAPSPKEAVQQLSNSRSVRAWLMSPFGFVVNALFIFFTGLYLAASPGMYRDGLVALFPEHRRDEMRRVLDESGAALWKWTLAQMASMAIIAILSWIGLMALGVPMAAILAVFTGLLVFVPNVGPILSVIPPMLMSFSLGPNYPLYVLLLYTGIQLVESYLVTPLIQEHENNLPAAIVIASQLLLGVLYGILGITFAMPIVLVAMIFVQRLYIGKTLEGKPA